MNILTAFLIATLIIMTISLLIYAICKSIENIAIDENSYKAFCRCKSPTMSLRPATQIKIPFDTFEKFYTLMPEQFFSDYSDLCTNSPLYQKVEEDNKIHVYQIIFSERDYKKYCKFLKKQEEIQKKEEEMQKQIKDDEILQKYCELMSNEISKVQDKIAKQMKSASDDIEEICEKLKEN